MFVSSFLHSVNSCFCRRNILLPNLYCKAGSPENSSFSVACSGCIPAPKRMRRRYFHMQPEIEILHKCWLQGFNVKPITHKLTIIKKIPSSHSTLTLNIVSTTNVNHKLILFALHIFFQVSPQGLPGNPIYTIWYMIWHDFTFLPKIYTHYTIF